MRVVVTQERDDWGEYESLEIVIDDKTKFHVYHTDSPEDNVLYRNFSDCYDIPELLRKAYRAGLRQEGFEVIYEEEDEN